MSQSTLQNQKYSISEILRPSLGQLQAELGTTLGQPQDNLWTTSVQPLDNLETTPGQPRDNLRTTLGQPRDNLGTILGQPRGSLESPSESSFKFFTKSCHLENLRSFWCLKSFSVSSDTHHLTIETNKGLKWNEWKLLSPWMNTWQ